MSPSLPSGPVLVTGATGFIGSALCRRLAASGVETHGVARGVPTEDGIGVSWSTADVADASSVRSLVRRIRPCVVFHLAGEVTGVRDLEAVLSTYHGNLTSTVNVLAAAEEVGCERIVLPGSLEEPGREAGAWSTPSSPYAASKWAASAYGRAFHALYGTPVAIARTFMVYGPRQRNRNKLIPYVIGSLLRGEPPRLSGGAREIDWIYIDDVVDGLLAVSTADGLAGATVDLGSGEGTSIRRLVEELVDITGAAVQPAFGALPDRPYEQVRTANVREAAERLGWRPATGLREGLERTVDWYGAEDADVSAGATRWGGVRLGARARR